MRNGRGGNIQVTAKKKATVKIFPLYIPLESFIYLFISISLSFFFHPSLLRTKFYGVVGVGRVTHYLCGRLRRKIRSALIASCNS